MNVIKQLNNTFTDSTNVTPPPCFDGDVWTAHLQHVESVARRDEKARSNPALQLEVADAIEAIQEVVMCAADNLTAANGKPATPATVERYANLILWQIVEYLSGATIPRDLLEGYGDMPKTDALTADHVAAWYDQTTPPAPVDNDQQTAA